MFLLMGSHLFDTNFLLPFKDQTIVMIEDFDLCTHFLYHKQKLCFFLEAMRNHRDLLISQGFKVVYRELCQKNKNEDFFSYLDKSIKNEKIIELTSFFIEDKFFREKLEVFCLKQKLSWMVIESPLFLNSQQEIIEALPDKKPLMKKFYQAQRLKRNILMTNEKKPVGGKFSFDQENRRKLPNNLVPPSLPRFKPSPHFSEVALLVEELFSKHPGQIKPWLPTTRKDALKALDTFLRERLSLFGDYEDAMDESSPFLYHSVLSPLINCGLLTPAEILEKVLSYANLVPINSLEGFVRQILGWREFIRGIYEKFSVLQEESNFFNHQRKLSKAWYEGNTGLRPLDDVIQRLQSTGYCHHIERLMVVSNLMLLCEIEPRDAHRWFMEMFVDSADWVMGPNVFGMGQASDGGLFTTKPYICGSNYILKMSSYKKGEWCEIMDGLYWRFINKHQDYFLSQPRLAMMPRMLKKMDKARKNKLLKIADKFIEQATVI